MILASCLKIWEAEDTVVIMNIGLWINNLYRIFVFPIMNNHHSYLLQSKIPSLEYMIGLGWTGILNMI